MTGKNNPAGIIGVLRGCGKNRKANIYEWQNGKRSLRMKAYRRSGQWGNWNHEIFMVYDMLSGADRIEISVHNGQSFREGDNIEACEPGNPMEMAVVNQSATKLI